MTFCCTCDHYSDIIMSMMASQITTVSLFAQPFRQALIKNLISMSLSLCKESTVCDTENVTIWWCHHGSLKMVKISHYLGQVTNCGYLVTWFCYQLIAKSGYKTAKVSWPNPSHCTLSMDIDPLSDYNLNNIKLYWYNLAIDVMKCHVYQQGMVIFI